MNNQDSSGQFWDIALDVVFTVESLLNVVKNPKDAKAWVALGADLICTFIPFATGGGIAVRAASRVDNAIDAGRAMNRAGNVADAGKTINRGDNLSNLALCFVAGTLVLAEEGKTSIENVKVGDKVYAENPETGEKGLKEVVQTFVNETDELIHIQIEKETISATPEHPFYVKNEGWISAKDLRAGDILVLQDGGYVVVEKIQHEILESPIKVYNFEVADYHTYYVGDSGVLVHNECGYVSVEKLISGLEENTRKYGIARNFQSTGGFEKALSDFDSLGLMNTRIIQTKYGTGRLGFLPTGGRVVARPGSKTGGATLDIYISNTKQYKIRY